MQFVSESVNQPHKYTFFYISKSYLFCMLIMNKILKWANEIFVLKQKKNQALLFINYIYSLYIYMLIMNQIIKQTKAICFKSACCYNHGACLHLYTIHEPSNQASESNFF